MENVPTYWLFTNYKTDYKVLNLELYNKKGDVSDGKTFITDHSILTLLLHKGLVLIFVPLSPLL